MPNKIVAEEKKYPSWWDGAKQYVQSRVNALNKDGIKSVMSVDEKEYIGICVYRSNNEDETVVYMMGHIGDPSCTKTDIKNVTDKLEAGIRSTKLPTIIASTDDADDDAVSSDNADGTD